MLGIKFSKETVDKLELELEIAQKLNNLRLYKIVKSLLMIHEGKSASDIGKQLNQAVRTIYDWFAKFVVRRFGWLCGHHYQGRGRKPRLNDKQRRELFECIAAGPEASGYDRGIWNSAMIVIEIEKRFGVTYSPRYVCELMKKMGLSYQKAKFIPGKVGDEAWEATRAEWENTTWPGILVKAKELGAVILFGDEVSFAQWGSLGRTWAPKGQQPTVKTSGTRKGLKMFGVIEFKKGEFIYQECDEKFNGQTYIEFLEHVLGNYSCPVILIEDGAPYHRGADVTQFKKEKEEDNKLYTYRLPSYSPDKNPIEKLWKKTKADATHCKYFPTFDDLRNAVINAFNKYLQDAMEVISVMKKLRVEACVA